jgi:hypothetical protein
MISITILVPHFVAPCGSERLGASAEQAVVEVKDLLDSIQRPPE